jgi:hypothetical protein
MIDKEEIRRKIQEEEDFIYCPKLGYSLSRYLMSNSDGVEISTIARLLLITEEEVQKIYLEAIELLKKDMFDRA